MNKRTLVGPLMAAMLARSGAIKPYAGPPPTRMNVRSTPRHIMEAFEVWFNDERQTRCTVADAERGYIVRFVGKSSHNEERLEGKVEFKRKVKT